MRRARSIAAAAAGVLLLAAGASYAHSGASGVVKERMQLMKQLGDAMKSLSAMMRGQADYDPGRVRALAGEISAHGGEALTAMFPEGSLEGPSEALPAIWSDWQHFADLAARLSDMAGALEVAADNRRAGQGMAGGLMLGSSMRGENAPSPEMLAGMPPQAAFMQLAQVCSACHGAFRQTND